MSRRVMIGLAIAATGMSAIALSQLGWCWKQHRFISRQEMVDAAIDQISSHRRVTVSTPVPGGRRFAAYDVIPYEGRAAFRAANPDCCQIGPAGGDSGDFASAWQRWSGAIPHNVRMAYVVRYRDDAGVLRAYEIKDNVPVTSCGTVPSLRG